MLSRILIPAVLALLCSLPAIAQGGYRLPPQEVVDIIDAPSSPMVRFSPDRQWMLLVERSAMPSIADVSRRMLRLAGMRIDPAANARYTTTFYSALSLRSLDGRQEVRIPLPSEQRLASVTWSHDSMHFAFVVIGQKGSSLYGCSVASAATPVLLSDELNTVMGGPVWMPDGATILARLNPSGRAEEPVASLTPAGPNTQATSGNTSPLRTYQDLLGSSHDEELFTYFATSQAALISVNGGALRLIGDPQIFQGLAPSPDGMHFLATTMRRPYSYLMPWYNFPKRIAVWDIQGQELHHFSDIPLAENVPLGGVAMGPRLVQWNPYEAAGLLWVVALDQGDPKVEVEYRDMWMSSTVFSDEDPDQLLATEHRASGLTFLEDQSLLIASEYDRDLRWTRSILYRISGDTRSPVILDDRSFQDSYGHPGSFVMTADEAGHSVVRVDSGVAYRTGRGASDDGLLPFLDRVDLRTGKIDRLWRCALGSYEAVVGLLPEQAATDLHFITRYETPTSPPNYYSRSVGGGESTRIKLTDYADPTPQLRGITKQLVTYERADGVPLSATLYLPAGYEEGTKLPLLVWAYPREFNDPKTAAQVTSSPSRFTRIGGLSHLVLLTQGYAIMDGATMPVVGDPETMNDTFIEQVVAASQAAIDKAVELGVADGNTVFVGGHSYGAFMTANLLAHCDLFTSGVARSGAYNRTLTPFGFQSERRTFWEAPEAYFGVSPFMHADKINEPLLIIHGEIDNNSGTFPLQSERLFQAIKGNGGTARLVMLPNESHGYRARESVLHVHAETIDWFKQFIDRPE